MNDSNSKKVFKVDHDEVIKANFAIVGSSYIPWESKFSIQIQDIRGFTILESFLDCDIHSRETTSRKVGRNSEDTFDT